MGGVVSAVTGAIGASGANKAAQNAANESNALDQQIYDTALNNNQPFLQAGQGAVNELAYLEGVGGQQQPGAAGAGGQGSLLQPFTYQQLYQDPSYGFRLNQGLNALQSSAAARGTLTSGAGLKAVNNYAQDYASQEYQNAFNRYNTTQNNIYSRLAGLSGIGQTASAADTAAGENYATQYGQNVWGAANAQGANSLAQANAWAQGLNSISNFIPSGGSSAQVLPYSSQGAADSQFANITAPGAAFSSGL